ncbi:MAG: hypothetical protein JSS81_26105 [Acidobacteria bacterium]|nr:hypothetical protein [Acidobacteriota bacterium]
MKKLFPLVLALCFLTESCQVADSLLGKYYLFQTYFISASRRKTSVDATVYSERLGKFDDIRPVRSVTFNGVDMTNGKMPVEYSDDFPPCEPPPPKSDYGLSVNPKFSPTPDPLPESAYFFAAADGYQNNNAIVVTDQDGNRYPVRIDFEPVEPVDSAAIVISRSKSSVIKLKGRGSGKPEEVDFFISQSAGGRIDSSKADYRPADNSIVIPAEAARGLLKGKAAFELSSRMSGALDQSHISHFFITFHSRLCVDIVD